MTAPAPAPPRPPDAAEAERRAREKGRAPIILLAIGVAIAAAGGQGILGAGKSKVMLGFFALGAGAAFAVVAALLGRVETRRWLAVAGVSVPAFLAARFLVGIADERLGLIAAGAFIGGSTACLAARLLDRDWARLASASAPKSPRVPPSAPVPKGAKP